MRAPSRPAGSPISGVRASTTTLHRVSRTSASTQAAVTPRAPPETTTTDPAGNEAWCMGERYELRDDRLASTVGAEPHLELGAAGEGFVDERVVGSPGGRPPRLRSIARQPALGHSCAAVFTRPGRPPSAARSEPRGRSRPRCPARSRTRRGSRRSWRACARRGGQPRATRASAPRPRHRAEGVQEHDRVGVDGHVRHDLRRDAATRERGDEERSDPRPGRR